MTNREIEIILTSKIFKGFDEESIHKALHCLKAKLVNYKDSTQIFPLGELTHFAPLIIDGYIDVSIINNAANKFIMTRFKSGEVLALANALSDKPNQIMDIRTHGTTRVLMLDLSQLINYEINCCPCKMLLMQNLLSILSNKMVKLQNKFQILTQKSLQDKLILLLEQLSSIQNSRTVVLNCTREELAQRVCAERSAVSRQLCRMKSEGLIEIDQNKITLLQTDR